MSSTSLTFFVILGLDPRISALGNSKIPYYVIPRLDRGISSNRRHCEGAKRPKQSLRILDFI
ncbi:MAG: hypothetical protein MR878_04835 [Campylobacter sp.]|nr:hypothetical protein [Campylobacter sp.]